VLRLFCAGSVVLTVIGLLTRLVCFYLLHLTQYPYGLYTLPHNGNGIDLMLFYVRFQRFHSPEFFSPAGGSVYAYPAAVAPLYWLFYRVRYAQIPFLLIATALVAGLAWLFTKVLRRHGLPQSAAYVFVTIAVVFSFPLYFEFMRANMELFMWLISASGVYAFLRGRLWLSAALLGIAIPMKLYPIILLGLFVSRRQYTQAVFSLLVAGITTLVCLWLICPDIHVAWKGINEGVQQFQVGNVVPYVPGILGVDHSLFALVKRVCGVLPYAQYAHILSVYTLSGAVVGVLCYVMRMRKLPLTNQVLCLTVASVVLPPISYEYTLLHLYTPFAMLVVFAVDAYRSGRTRVPGLPFIFACFTILLSQIGEIILHGDRLEGQIKAVTLVALFTAGMIYPFADPYDAQHSVASLAITP